MRSGRPVFLHASNIPVCKNRTNCVTYRLKWRLSPMAGHYRTDRIYAHSCIPALEGGWHENSGILLREFGVHGRRTAQVRLSGRNDIHPEAENGNPRQDGEMKDCELTDDLKGVENGKESGHEKRYQEAGRQDFEGKAGSKEGQEGVEVIPATCRPRDRSGGRKARRAHGSLIA